MDKFIHSVKLDKDACTGCINCIKYCPTQAIRVHGGKASIKPQFCVDCGRCIRYCPHHAKIAESDSLDEMRNYRYTVALPAPSLRSVQQSDQCGHCPQRPHIHGV
ncbi:4Fe-4S dicluster domain-containing protein [Eubacterium sp. ER2]|uniref:4Fe-4S dicluster domain-containing protein n=1 Tax=Eubacterium sp. ER2 TaxID=1519438 RepID=UPI00350FF420